MTDTDHPTQLDTFDFCTRCKRCVLWKYLTPLTTPSGGIEILCVHCEQKRLPVQCEEN